MTRSGIRDGKAFESIAEELKHIYVTAPATPIAATWQGHRYGLQALKPAAEPIIVFQKPYRGKPVENITRTGAGALWIDGARVGIEQISVHHFEGQHAFDKGRGIKPYEVHAGRWASNLILAHHPDCNGTCVDGCAVKALGEQSGQSVTTRTETPCISDGMMSGYSGGLNGHRGARGHTDSGTAARFFYQVSTQLDAADPVRYVAKASRRERDAGLEGFATRVKTESWNDSTELADRMHGKTQYRNVHPTVKPIALARYLATLLLPPSEYAPRRLFVPFAGVASECIGAMQAGWDEIVGVEREQEYIEIARARAEHWQAQMSMQLAA